MYEADRDNISFIIEWANYQYNVMPFALDNTEATYQRMVNKIFA